MNRNGSYKQRVWQDIQENEPALAKLLLELKREFGEIKLKYTKGEVHERCSKDS